MDIEVKTALQVCKDCSTARSLSIGILLSVAYKATSLTFGHAPTDEEADEARGQLLKFGFDPYARTTLALHSANGSFNIFDRAPRKLVPALVAMQANIALSRRDYQSTVFLQKWRGYSVPEIDPEVEAKKSFWISEQECFDTNRRFSEIIKEIDGSDDLPNQLPSRMIQHLVRVRKIFRDTIGPLPRLEQLELRFGPGSVLERKEAYGVMSLTAVDKLDATPYVTPGALEVFYEVWKDTTWFREWYPRSVVYNLPLYTVVEAERFFTVPKNAKTHRGCALGPSANIAIQLAVAKPMRQALQRVGLLVTPRNWWDECNLSHGTHSLERRAGSEEIHHRLAQRGSVTEESVTVDFSRASDTVARGPVKFLASPAWFELLDSIRCKKILLDFDRSGNTTDQYQYVTERFSAMGNGFTFELETLIFYSLARSVCGPEAIISVYGDDVILPKEYAQDFIALARFFGFTPNIAKTYIAGPFRESCGGDFLHGENIRPYFQKEIVNEPAHAICLANGLHRSSGGHASTRDLYLSRAWRTVIASIPSLYRDLRGPEGLGDSVIHDVNYRDYALAPKGWVRDRVVRVHGTSWVVTQKPRTLVPFKWGRDSQSFYRGVLLIPEKRSLDRYDPATQYAAALYGVGSEGVAPRGAAVSTAISIFQHG